MTSNNGDLQNIIGSDGLKPELHTSEFRLQPSVHSREAMERWIGRYWFFPAVPVVVFLAVGVFSDWRFLVVAAAVLCVLLPAVAMVAWYAVLTRRCALRSISPHRVTLFPDNHIEIDYGNGDITMIPAESVSQCRMWGKYVVVSYRDTEILIIPESAFGDIADTSCFVERLDGGIGR